MDKMNREYAKYFEGQNHFLQELETLNARMNDIRDSVKSAAQKRPLVMTFVGSPRTGKTTIAGTLFDFYKKCGIKTVFLHEPAEVVHARYQSDEQKAAATADKKAFNIYLRDFAFRETQHVFDPLQNTQPPELIIYDRGYIDSHVWMHQHLTQKLMDKKEYEKELLTLRNFNKDFYNIVFATYAPAEVSLMRDYRTSLCLLPRKKINEPNLNLLNDALLSTKNDIATACDSYHMIDCSEDKPNGIMETSIACANLFAKDMGIV